MSKFGNSKENNISLTQQTLYYSFIAPTPTSIIKMSAFTFTMESVEALKKSLGNKKEQFETATKLEAALAGAEGKTVALLVPEVVTELLALGNDAKAGKTAKAVLTAAVAKTVEGEGEGSQCAVIRFLHPTLQTLKTTKQWKVKVACLEFLESGLLLDSLATHAPKQLKTEMATMVNLLVECSKEVRAEIKTTSAKLLEKIGQLVTCTEVRGLADKIVNCLKNFGNMKLATETLYAIANTTFLSYVDAASFALLFPLVSRAMKETNFDSKKNGIMIVGAAVVLIEEASILDSYLPLLLPTLKELALEPTFEIQREAAKALGSLGKHLPSLLDEDILPWALENLESTKGGPHASFNDRTGAGHALAEICNVCPDKTLLPRMLNTVIKPRMFSPESSVAARDGAFKYVEFLCKVDAFESHAREYALSWLLLGLKDSDKDVHEQAYKTAQALVHEFGAANSDAFVHPLSDAVLSFPDEPRLNSLSAKAMCMALFRKLVEKVSEARKYGTDMMTMDCCPQETRLAFVCLLQVTRNDVDPEVRRNSNKVLAEQLQSVAKTKKEVMPSLLATLKNVLDNSSNANKRQSAERCLSELKTDGFCGEDCFEGIEASKTVLRSFDWDVLKTVENAAETKICVKKGKAAAAADEAASEDADVVVEWKDLHVRCEKELKELNCGNAMLEAVVMSCVNERHTAESALNSLKSAVGAETADEKISTLLNKVFAGYFAKELKTLENPEEILCHVENLMLMYGGGHMLLKDTTLELRKAKRYGVLGRNGTGKTTLMNLIAAGQVPGIPKEMTCIHVKPEVLDNFMTTKCKKFMEIENPNEEISALEQTLEKVMFPKELWNVTIGELSGGWRMRLLIAGAMMKKADVLLLDEPTNHLDIAAVKWLCDYLVSLDQSAIMVISHDPFFLNKVCTNIINYNSGKLVYYEGNFDAFTARMGINAADAEAILSGNVGVGANGIERPEEEAEKKKAADAELAKDEASTVAESPAPSDESNDGSTTEAGDASPGGAASAPTVTASGTVQSGSGPDRKAKIVFPIAGKVKGLTSLAKPVLEINDLSYAYNEEKGNVFSGIKSKITMNSRIHIKGVNGAGKTTFMNLICGEVHPNASALPQQGTVARHRNCRLAYMAQQHMHHMAAYMDVSPYIYIQKRYANGCDGALQQRLMEPKNEEEYEDRVKRAKQYGKYGNMLKNLVGRQQRGKEFVYEAQWQNLDDTSKNTWVTMNDLKNLGCESFALAYDDRAAAAEGGLDQRPLSQREITKHLEQFGITEELALNRTIGMFSAGQKSKVSLAAAFWIKPHLVALDEPTNYIDMETLDALTVALQRFKGGVICISHCGDFVSKVCNEIWTLEGGNLVVTKTDEKDAKKK